MHSPLDRPARANPHTIHYSSRSHTSLPNTHTNTHPTPHPQGLLRSALAKEAELAASVPGYSPIAAARDRYTPVLADARLRGLAKLRESRKLIEKATGAVTPLQSPGGAAALAAQEAAEMADATPATAVIPQGARTPVASIVRPSGLQPLGAGSAAQRPHGNPNIRDPILVIIRHGKTEYNKCVVGCLSVWVWCLFERRD